jgi:hypothetical protein
MPSDQKKYVSGPQRNNLSAEFERLTDFQNALDALALSFCVVLLTRRFNDGIGARDEHLKGDTLGIKESENPDQVACIGAMLFEVLELG